MNIVINRLNDNGSSTVGTFSIDGVTECFTLEETFNEPKILGNTRIPSGTYKAKLRDAGGMTKKYAKRFPFHSGMLWLQNVDNFEWVYIHVGNTEADTEGCILVGQGCTIGENQSITSSTSAYSAVYPRIANAILQGEDVSITIV